MESLSKTEPQCDEEDEYDDCTPTPLVKLIQSEDVAGIEAHPSLIEPFKQSCMIEYACETENPEVLQAVLSKFPTTCKYFCYIKKSFEGQTRLNPWDAVGRGSVCDLKKPAHSAKMAAVIISHPFFVGDCELVGCSPDKWQSMIGLFSAAYGSDPLIWNAVKNNDNLPQEARDEAAKLMQNGSSLRTT